MKKLILIIITPFLIFSKPLTVNDINTVLSSIFDQHIQFKEMDELIIKRSFKSYINQVDPLKIYLIESEIEPYLNMSDISAKKIAKQIQKNDY